MNFDLRLPLGLMLSIFGGMLAIYGLVPNAAAYQKSLGIDINLWWGAVMLAIGLLMLAGAWRARRHRR